MVRMTGFLRVFCYMKLSNIEYPQRAQELAILLNFYLMQIKPIDMKPIAKAGISSSLKRPSPCLYIS